MLVLQSSENQVIQVGVKNALGFGGQTNFGVLMAAGIVASLPPLILFVLMQRDVYKRQGSASAPPPKGLRPLGSHIAYGFAREAICS